MVNDKQAPCLDDAFVLDSYPNNNKVITLLTHNTVFRFWVVNLNFLKTSLQSCSGIEEVVNIALLMNFTDDDGLTEIFPVQWMNTYMLKSTQFL